MMKEMIEATSKQLFCHWHLDLDDPVTENAMVNGCVLPQPNGKSKKPGRDLRGFPGL